MNVDSAILLNELVAYAIADNVKLLLTFTGFQKNEDEG